MKIFINSTSRILVPFHDVDFMNVVWHGNYPKYLEIARCDLFRIIGYDIPIMNESGFAWPVINLKIKYIKPAFYNQELIVEAGMTEYLNRIRIEYVIKSAATTEKICKATTDQVAVEIATGSMMYASPEILIKKVEEYLCEKA